MSNTNDGGPAFPTDDDREAHALGLHRPRYGVSVRDYFAASALGALISTDKNEIKGVDTLARESYEIADAMLAERAK